MWLFKSAVWTASLYAPGMPRQPAPRLTAYLDIVHYTLGWLGGLESSAWWRFERSLLSSAMGESPSHSERRLCKTNYITTEFIFSIRPFHIQSKVYGLATMSESSRSERMSAPEIFSVDLSSDDEQATENAVATTVTSRKNAEPIGTDQTNSGRVGRSMVLSDITNRR